MDKYFISHTHKFLTALLFILVLAQVGAAQTVEAKQTGRLPVIIIPGLLGSELVNKNTGEKVWFDLTRSKTDDLRLPVSPNLAANRDDLIPRDIIRSVQLIKFFPKTEIYEGLLESLQKDGYAEGNWETPAENGAADTYYVFAYDWRRDNVETARLLLEKIENLRTRLKQPILKFNVIGHSMGGLIARYAAMYAGADLPAGTRRPTPTWKGSNYFHKIFLLGSPNLGSINALNAAINGFAIFGNPKLNLPFFQNLTRLDVFTIPTIYQVLPHARTLRVFDENLKPLQVDIYNPLTWEKYGWAAYSDDDFTKKFDAAEQKNARAYFRAALLRGKRFQEALVAGLNQKSPVRFYYFGSECRPTLDGMVIYRNGKKNRWTTLFKADTFTRSDGTKVTEKELQDLLFATGDGVVTRRSFLLETKNVALQTNLSAAETTIVCEDHGRLAENADIRNRLLAALQGNQESDGEPSTRRAERQK